MDNLTIYGGDKPIDALHQKLPSMRVMSKATLKSSLIPYIANGNDTRVILVAGSGDVSSGRLYRRNLDQPD